MVVGGGVGEAGRRRRCSSASWAPLALGIEARPGSGAENPTSVVFRRTPAPPRPQAPSSVHPQTRFEVRVAHPSPPHPRPRPQFSWKQERQPATSPARSLRSRPYQPSQRPDSNSSSVRSSAIACPTASGPSVRLLSGARRLRTSVSWQLVLVWLGMLRGMRAEIGGHGGGGER